MKSNVTWDRLSREQKFPYIRKAHYLAAANVVSKKNIIKVSKSLFERRMFDLHTW